MRMFTLVTLVLAVFLSLTLVPVQTSATLLWGHPYAMYYDREAGSPNFDIGMVYMFDSLNPVSMYIGRAEIDALATGGFFAQGIWESLRDAMMNKKLVGLYTDAGPDTNVNDGSSGKLTAFVITIFGP
jgi:hypothetical protein